MSNATSMYAQRFTLSDPVHGEVPCVELAASESAGLPLCLFLYGGGGRCDTLISLEPLLSAAWRDGSLPPCRFMTAEVPPWGFYLDDPARGLAWETLVGERLPAVARRGGTQPVSLLGISMGGYGALKIALSRPQQFVAVAAIAPMIEPSLHAEPVRPRNRYHYPPEVPASLLGTDRDAALYAADHPAQRARKHAAALRASQLGIYIDAGTDDALHAHDGAELLHRVLWDLDIRHDYHLWSHADHVGPSLLPRLRAALAWTGQRLAPAPQALGPDEQAWQRFLDGEVSSPPEAPLAPTSPLMPRVLRYLLAPLRQAAASQDRSVDRVFGLLPPL